VNYQIIKNMDLFLDFIDFLPDLETNETYYVCLLARSKYVLGHGLASDKSQLKRVTATKKTLVDKVRQMEVAVGCYKKGEDVVPQESLALYLTPNPRCFVKATRTSLIQFAHLITQKYNGYNPHQEVMSQIHKSCSRKVFIDFDFDTNDFEVIRNKLLTVVNHDCLFFLKTKNGFHVLVEVGKIHSRYEKSWYRNIASIPGCDVKGDNMIPVPGCVQGDFVPHFV
jgi:hypothetical protein